MIISVLRRGVALVFALLLYACNTPDPPTLSPLALKAALQKHSVAPWYPASIDTAYGGYLSDFNAHWNPEGDQNKMIVSQARHIWVCSKLAHYYVDDDRYLIWAHHGFEFLSQHMWDSLSGGFYQTVDRMGMPLADTMKTDYGNAFAIYGLAAYYKASNNKLALALAQQTFNWLEQHSYDSTHGGYFQFLTPQGTAQVEGYQGTPPKDQNSSIHLLEAYTELYQVWPDSLLKTRLEELLVLIRDTITTDKGTMNLFFESDWTPFLYSDLNVAEEDHFNLDHVSFGHDIETAYLLLEAAELLGGSHYQSTLPKAKLMVDHSLQFGWDESIGGVFDGAYYLHNSDTPKIVKQGKVWWSQAESLNSLSLFGILYPEDQMEYTSKSVQQWDYIQNNLIDHEYHGWYWGGLDMEPHHVDGPKGQVWKVNYHTVRSLLNVIKRLEVDDQKH